MTLSKPSPLRETYDKFLEFESFVFGLALSYAFSYPAPPFYILSFIVFLISTKNIFLVRNFGIYFKVALLISLALISNLISSYQSIIPASRALYSSIFFVFLIFGSLTQKKLFILRGFAYGSSLVALTIIVKAISLKIWKNGTLLFSQPHLRLWGADFFPDWPNYIAFSLSLAFLLNLLVFRKYALSGLCFLAAILTTSRTPLMAAVFGAIYVLLATKDKRIKLAIIAAGSASLSLGVLLLPQRIIKERLLLVSDRTEIADFGKTLFSENPFLGKGSVLMDTSIGHYGFPSFHNSYLDILVRYGAIGLIAFLMCILPSKNIFNKKYQHFLPIIFFFLVASFAQNFLRHPHFIMLYMVILSIVEPQNAEKQ